MKKALIVWGGWDGHEPKLVAERFARTLREEGFEVTVSKMVKVEGSKKKVQQDTVTAFTYDGVKSCKPVIKFK
jgi:type 1 glutamine amidotransferase